MSSGTVTLVSDDTSLRMPIKGGELVLYRDGTYGSRGPVTHEEIVTLFLALEPPASGRVWWKIFALSNLFQHDEIQAKVAFDRLELLPNEWTLIRNPKMMTWLQESGLFRSLSVSVFVDVKKHLWDATLDQPRTDKTAKRLAQYILKLDRNPSRKELMQIARA